MTHSGFPNWFDRCASRLFGSSPSGENCWEETFVQRTPRPNWIEVAIAVALIVAAFSGGAAMAQPPMPPGLEPQPSIPPDLEGLPPQLPPSTLDGPSDFETVPAPQGVPQPVPSGNGGSSGPRAEFGPAPGTRPMDSGIEGEGEIVFEGSNFGQPMWQEGFDGPHQFQTFCDEPVCDGFPFMWDLEATWSFRTEFMVLHRQGPRNVLITRDGSTPEGLDLLTTKDIKFNIEPGMRLTAVRFLGSDMAKRDYLLEMSYFGLHDWDEVARVTGQPLNLGGGVVVGSLLSNFDPSIGGFNRAILHQIEYASQLDSVEANLRIRTSPRREQMVYRPQRGWMVEPSRGFNFSMLGGLRMLVIDETFEFDSVGLVQINGASVGDLGGTYDIETRNRLFGAQIGLAIDSQSPRFSWSVTGRLGPYYNFLQQQQVVSFNDAADPFATDVPGFTRRDSDERVALAGQLSITGRFRLFEHVNLRAGYDFLWVQGLVLAPEQLDFFLAASPTNRNGKALYQGLSLGAEVVW